ncbi:LysR family transcriptional regulator [Flexivirga sp.]|uniref:LysR family transcriptional regulator n=1 Tax=Flexivirga sp. TaxID=1962927 RepID=UPI003F7F7008
MEFRQLDYFRTVVDKGSVSGAAKALGLSQPTLTTAIIKLERDLGVQLLERSARGVAPTEVGRYLLANARRLLADRERLSTTISLMAEGLVGDLRVGLEPMVIHEVMADVLTEFIRQAPAVNVMLTDTTPDRIVEGLIDGSLDVGCVPFAADRFADAVRDMCDWSPIARIALRLAVPRSRAEELHPDGHGWGRWILPRPMREFSGMPDDAVAALGADDDFRTIEVSTPQTAVAFVAAGLGVAPVTQRLVGDNPAVAVLDAPSWMRPMQATVIWRKDQELTPHISRWLAASRLIAGRRLGPANVI